MAITRQYLHIDLNTRIVTSDDFTGEALARAGRHFIARTLLDMDVAGVDPLSPDNPLIFSAGPFAGTNFSNANRLSVGCKSPLTGGVKESNAGGTFAFAMGQLEIAGFTLHGAADDWVVIRVPQEGDITFEDATPYMGLGVNETAEMLHEKYGKKISLAICGPVGEYLGMVAGISISDHDNRPSRLAARGGVGAVMGSKKVKAIVLDKVKMPPLHDLRSVMTGIKGYNKGLDESVAVQNMKNTGTALVADLTNHLGGLPVRNFTSGRLTESEDEVLKMGGDFIREQNKARGGEISHACMPGCQIKCSNVYVDKDANEIVSPLEYETICLLGTNCGLKDPDDVARMNALANDLGIDTIEIGAAIAVLMDAGEAEFGDVGFMEQVFDDLRQGTERGRMVAQGTAHVGEHFGVHRIPVIKRQAISAYDPRVIEGTGVSMVYTAQGADHTVGNLPTLDTKEMSILDIAKASRQVQINSALADSTGLCLFGRSVTDVNHEMIIKAMNDALGTDLPADFLITLGREAIAMEMEFNEKAGFTVDDDRLPDFFDDEPLQPTNRTARLKGDEIRAAFDEIIAAEA